MRNLIIWKNELSETNGVSITIYDIVGKAVKIIPAENLQLGKNTLTIDLSDLSNGVYFCKINSSENVQTVKFIKD